MTTTTTEGYASVGDLRMYWRSLGSGGTPLIVVHGGYGLVEMFGDLLPRLAEHRRVIAVELQGHGRTRDVDRPFRWESFGDDVAALVDALDLGQADLLGYSLGGGAVLRAAVQHPDRVRRLVLVSAPYRREAWYPEVRAGFDGMDRQLFDMLRQSPMYEGWRAVAPDVDSFPTLIDKTGDLLRQPYDWADDVRGLSMPVLLVYADADGIPPAHAAELYGLLGGGQRDAGWDGSGRPASQLAILPGRTHYDVLEAPELGGVVDRFLS
ncbi:MAG: alpha/beta fold hydrolase [Actinomycetes bacterium]